MSNSISSNTSAGQSVLKVLVLTAGALVIGLSTALARENKKTEEQYWAEAGINKAYLLNDDFVSQASCSRELVRFIGCFESVRTMVASVDGWDLIPDGLVGSSAFPQVVESQILGEGFTRVRFQPMDERVSEKDMALKDLYQLKVSRTAAVNAALTKKFNGLAVSKVDFANLVELAEAQLLTTTSADKLPAVYASAISGFMGKAIDPHARIASLKMHRDNEDDPNESFVGIGAMLKSAMGKVVIVSIIDGGSAKAVGLKANDVIVTVDGSEVEGQPLEQVINKIRGPAGTTVRLHILREGQSVRFDLVRKPVEIQNVTVKVEKILDRDYLVINLRSFMDTNACQIIKSRALQALSTNSAVQGVIFDLRGNGGGRLDQGVCITSLFVGRKPIVHIKSLTGQRSSTLSGSEDEITALPLVTLIDSRSASASEIFAGAVQDYGRAWLVGDRSFGKGSVQSGAETVPDRILTFITIARFYQPSGRTNQLVGIEPDFDVPERPNMTENERFALREADLYPEALPATGAAWTQPRTKQVAEVQTCTGSAKSLAAYQEGVRRDGQADYQMLYAAEVLGCTRSQVVQN